jgi:hypothetical protein
VTLKLVHNFMLATILVGALAVVPSTLVAAPLFGTLDITGSATVGGTTIDWWPIGTGVGMFTVEPSSTGDFASLANTDGTAKDLDVMAQPVGMPFLLMDFLTFAAAPNIHFDLTFIEPGVYGSGDCFANPSPGQNCTPPFPPPISPFNLTNTPGGGSTAFFVVRGMVRNDLGGVTPFVGFYTTQFTMPYQQLLQTIQAGGTVDARSFSATLVAIPEPGTWSMILISGALFGVSSQIRRFRNRKS